MDAAELEEARDLFERAEREADPRRKHADAEEALDLLDALLEDESELSQGDRTLIRNLRMSNARRLLSQLMGLHDVHFDVWIDYALLLLGRLGPEVKALLEQDRVLRTAYESFVELGGPRAADALRQALAGPKAGA